MKTRPLALAVLLIPASWVGADDWPQWRGPDRTGVSKETGLLKKWPEQGPKLLWTFKNAGESFSSFSVVGGTLTGARPMQIDAAQTGSGRIVDYPPGFGRQGSTPAKS